MLKRILVVLGLVAAIAMAVPRSASAGVDFSVGIGVPGVVVAPPVYAPAYPYYPYYGPRVYYAPPPVYYGPSYYYGYGGPYWGGGHYYHRGGWHRGGWHHGHR